MSGRPLVLIARGLVADEPALRQRLALEVPDGAELVCFDSPDDGARLFAARGVDCVVLRVDARGEHRGLLALAQQAMPPVPVVGALPEGVAEPVARHAAAFSELLPEPPGESRLARSARNALRWRSLSRQLQEKEQELASVEEIGRTIISSLELQTVLNIIMEKTRELVQAESWSLLLAEEGDGGVQLSVAAGEGADRTRTGATVRPGEGIAGWVAREGKPVVVEDVANDPRWCGLEQAYGTGARSVLCVPLETRGRVLGVIEVVNKKGGEGFSQRDLSLVTRLAGFAAIAIENARLYQQTKQLTFTDELTRLYNTRFFTQYLDAEVKRCRRYRGHVSVIFLDLDHFKLVNDRHGHLMGSQLLREVADVLRRGVRDVDIVARYGGDEFIVILPETKLEAAAFVAERLRQAMNEHVFLADQGHAAHLTASFGVASFPETCSSEEELIRLADQAMYRVKNRTRNGVYLAQVSGAANAEAPA
ncbi:MAG TPA: sensor domain-containing diguanylate cyclase [bacterium]